MMVSDSSLVTVPIPPAYGESAAGHDSRRASEPTSRKFWALPGASLTADAGGAVADGPEPATVAALAWVMTTRSRSWRRWFGYQTPGAATRHTTAMRPLPVMRRRWGHVRRRRRGRRGAMRRRREAGCETESAMAS